MYRPGRTTLVALALAVAAGALAVAASGVVGPGMMGAGGTGTTSGAGYGMMGGPGMMAGGLFGGVGAGGAGSAGTAKPTRAELDTLRTRIDAWLGASGFAGFGVSEVMAFTNNDYVAVHDPSGAPAFELLTNLGTTWVMEEPPSMMWNTRFGTMRGLGGRVGPMMGGWMANGSWSGWYGKGGGKVSTTAEAVSAANSWLAQASPGEQVAADAGGSAMGKFPGYYSFDTTRDGKTVGMLSVNASTGAVWYHAWHGAFLAEADLSS